MPKRPHTAPVPQPHDNLFKYAFSQRQHAVGLLQSILPPDVATTLQWDTLTLEKGSFVDRALRSRHTDLLFSARMGTGNTYLYTIIEQQRAVDPLMIFRGGVYMMRAWEHILRDQPSLHKLPPMMLIVVHHGDAGWTAATSFEQLLDADEPARAALLPYTPRFQMKLVDLGAAQASQLADEALTALGKLVLWALSVAGDDARFERELALMGKALDAMLAGNDAVAALTAILEYLAVTHASVGAPRIVRMLEKTASAGQKEVVMDVLDVFRKEGRKEGRAEGRAQTLLEQLTARFGPVPAETKAKILAAKEPILARWSLQVLTAPTLEAALDAKAKKAAPVRRPTARKRARPS